MKLYVFWVHFRMKVCPKLTLYVNWAHLSRTDQKIRHRVGGGARAVAGGIRGGKPPLHDICNA